MTTSTLPFSSIRRIGNTVYLSGELGFDAAGQIVGDIVQQTETTLRRIEATLSDFGLSRRDIVSCTCYLVHKHDFADFNKAYRTFFSEGDLPVRTTIVTNLVLEALIEITVIAQAQEL
ncbi:RidA family protein [Agrobacterium radiobacter]|uniref:RidA family protein n=1 Tax=Agrobacterium radiobacter TaxID=362 RepID=UPI0034656AB9